MPIDSEVILIKVLDLTVINSKQNPECICKFEFTDEVQKTIDCQMQSSMQPLRNDEVTMRDDLKS